MMPSVANALIAYALTRGAWRGLKQALRRPPSAFALMTTAEVRQGYADMIRDMKRTAYGGDYSGGFTALSFDDSVYSKGMR